MKEADDAAAFPRARLAMDTDGREIGEAFIQDREEILSKFGALLFFRDATLGNNGKG